MDRLHSMRVFSRVIDEGSFAAAARALNVSPAVITRLVADLEEHLGARLVNRTTRRLALTDIGESYLERARQILAEVDDAEALASARRPSRAARSACCAPPAFAVHQLAKHLPAFRARYPKVSDRADRAGRRSRRSTRTSTSRILTEGSAAAGRRLRRTPARALGGDRVRVARVPRPPRPAAAPARARATTRRWCRASCATSRSTRSRPTRRAASASRSRSRRAPAL